MLVAGCPSLPPARAAAPRADFPALTATCVCRAAIRVSFTPGLPSPGTPTFSPHRCSLVYISHFLRSRWSSMRLFYSPRVSSPGFPFSVLVGIWPSPRSRFLAFYCSASSLATPRSPPLCFFSRVLLLLCALPAAVSQVAFVSLFVAVTPQPPFLCTISCFCLPFYRVRAIRVERSLSRSFWLAAGPLSPYSPSPDSLCLPSPFLPAPFPSVQIGSDALPFLVFWPIVSSPSLFLGPFAQFQPFSAVGAVPPSLFPAPAWYFPRPHLPPSPLRASPSPTLPAPALPLRLPRSTLCRRYCCRVYGSSALLRPHYSNPLQSSSGCQVSIRESHHHWE